MIGSTKIYSTAAASFAIAMLALKLLGCDSGSSGSAGAPSGNGPSGSGTDSTSGGDGSQSPSADGGSADAYVFDAGSVPSPKEAAALPANYVDGSGDCGSDFEAGSAWGHATCCESNRCSGYCALDDAGTVGCDCFGVQGGCPTGTVCCTGRRSCTTPDNCSISH